jgi:LPS export ABC transporter protein LptC
MKHSVPGLLLLLAACSNAGVAPPKASVEDSLSPDQTMMAMKTYIIRSGVKRSDVEADTAFVNQQTHLANLVGLRVTFFDSSTGRPVSVITSKTGEFNIETNRLDARGNVVATTSENKILKTEHLVYDKVQDRIHSDTSFTVTGSTENMSGTSFEADPGFKSVLVLRPSGREKRAPAKRPSAKRGGSK